MCNRNGFVWTLEQCLSYLSILAHSNFVPCAVTSEAGFDVLINVASLFHSLLTHLE